MALKDVFKVNRKTFFNPSAWLGLNQLKAGTSTIWNIFKDLITPPQPEYKETFEQAIKRLNTTEAEIKRRGHVYFIYAWFFIVLAAFSVGAGIYFLFMHKTLSGFLLGLLVSALFGSQAFRFHFWYFQIKHRKLGCTFDEWLKGRVHHKEPHK